MHGYAQIVLPVCLIALANFAGLPCSENYSPWDFHANALSPMADSIDFQGF
jgi:hypothetical protein